MSNEATPTVDFWTVLEEAKNTVAEWEPWKQRYDVDIYHESYPRRETAPSSDVVPERK